MLFALGCKTPISKDYRLHYKSYNDLIHASTGTEVKNEYLKAHMKNGDVYLYAEGWNTDNETRYLEGECKGFDANRYLFHSGYKKILIDSISVFETNKPLPSKDKSRMVAMGIITGMDVVLGIICLTVPKACFGSCPTFYLGDDSNVNYADAEGFSSSICKALEEGDIDALNNTKTAKNEFTLTLKNEAMESHAINKISVLAAKRYLNHRIYQTPDNKFFSANKLTELQSAHENGKDISSLLKAFDHQEYFNVTDSNQLNKKEIIELTFSNSNAMQKGLILKFRQTLLTTFLFYTAYSKMGNEVSDWIEKMNNEKWVKQKYEGVISHLGGIEVWAYNKQSKTWLKSGEYNEAGPIAFNLQLLQLPVEISDQKEIKIKIIMTRGMWRIDGAALASIFQEEHPIELPVINVLLNNQNQPEMVNQLAHDDESYLGTTSGESYQLKFELPTADDYELFVYSKGYYLEWMRQSWLDKKDIQGLYRMTAFDPLQWKQLAKEFKLQESEMESVFWGSKNSN